MGEDDEAEMEDERNDLLMSSLHLGAARRTKEKERRRFLSAVYLCLGPLIQCEDALGTREVSV